MKENTYNNEILTSEKQWELVNFCEFDKYAAQAYCSIHDVDESFNLGDITKVDETKLKQFNMICGGSPCQDFSVAGKQKGSVWTCNECTNKNDEPFEWNPLTVHYTKRHRCPNCGSENIDKSRSSLLVEWLRIIRVNKPNFGIYENVKNIVGKQFKETFKMFTNELEEYGYKLHWKVLNAKNYGIPQNRERVYLIFIKQDLDNGKFEFPESFDNGIRLKDILEEEVDEKYYISKDKVKKFLINLNSNYSYQVKREGGQENIVKQVGNISEGSVNWSNPQTGRIYSPSGISPTLNTCGGGQREPKIIQVGKLNSSQDGIVVDENGISPTHTAGHGNMPKVVKIGNVNPSGHGMNGNVYGDDGLAPTITTNKGEGNKIAIRQATKKGYIKCEIGGVADLSYPESKTRRGRIQDNGYISPTITATETNICRIESEIRIRKLIPLECFKLMGFTNKQFYKAMIGNTNVAKEFINEHSYLLGKTILDEAETLQGISNSQLYKQSGNSIVVDVLYYILVELYKAMPYLFDDLRLSSFFSGIGAFEAALDRLYESINSGYLVIE